MSEKNKSKITQVLQNLASDSRAKQEATDWLFGELFDELRGIARNLMRNEQRDHTLQPTALINEAYLKLVGQKQIQWENRAHFMNVAARAMRQVLVDSARRRAAAKRGGDISHVTLSDSIEGAQTPILEVLALDDALNRMCETHERMGRVVELRVFAGMKNLEIALILDVSKRTVANDWKFAKLWLNRELGETFS